MPTRLIRPIREADIPAVAAIYNHYILSSTATFEKTALSEDEMNQRVRGITAAGPYIVAEQQGRVVGFAYAHRWKAYAAYADTSEVTEYVASDCLRQGIGSALLQSLISLCRQQGLHALVACITAENTASRRMHEKHGFRQVSLFRQVGRKFDRWLDVADYELLIDDSVVVDKEG